MGSLAFFCAFVLDMTDTTIRKDTKAPTAFASKNIPGILSMAGFPCACTCDSNIYEVKISDRNSQN